MHPHTVLSGFLVTLQSCSVVHYRKSGQMTAQFGSAQFDECSLSLSQTLKQNHWFKLATHFSTYESTVVTKEFTASDKHTPII